MGGVFSDRSRLTEPSDRMSRKGGFQHNNLYKIISMKDKNVIEVAAVSTSVSSEVPLIVKKWTNAPNQKFKAVQINVGEFRISPMLKASEESPHVWDYQTANPLLFLNTWTSEPNQFFNAEEIYPKSKICFIKSNNDGLCLRNMGSGKQIALVPEDRRDARMHWKLETTY